MYHGLKTGVTKGPIGLERPGNVLPGDIWSLPPTTGGNSTVSVNEGNNKHHIVRFYTVGSLVNGLHLASH
jgi:hypothetical protein